MAQTNKTMLMIYIPFEMYQKNSQNMLYKNSTLFAMQKLYALLPILMQLEIIPAQQLISQGVDSGKKSLPWDSLWGQLFKLQKIITHLNVRASTAEMSSALALTELSQRVQEWNIFLSLVFGMPLSFGMP